MSPRDNGAAGKSAAPKAAVPSFDPTGFLAQQQRMAEALVASSQTFLEGLQEIARRSALLQAAFFQQALTGLASVTAAGSAGGSEDAAQRVAAAVEATVASLRDVMEAACRCHTEALATFRERIAGSNANAPCDAAPPRG